MALVLSGLVLLTGCLQAEPPGSDRSDSPDRSDRPAVRGAAGTAVRIVAVGDIACAPTAKTIRRTCRHAETAALAERIAPDHVIVPGDLQYETGTAQAFARSYDPTWGALKDITHAVPGNHAYRTPGAAGYFDYLGQEPPGYYAWDAGRWRVYQLNTNCTEINCRREARWFRRDLEAHPRRCSMMVMHHPRFSSGAHGNNPHVGRFWKIAFNHRVDVALAGHDHAYERFARKGPDGRARPHRGVLSFVSGTGGKSLYRKSTTKVGSRHFSARRFGVLVLRLRDGKIGWRFKGLDGVPRDRGRASCV